MIVIYALCEPSSSKIRYVGKTKYTPQQRLKGHIASARRKPKTKCAEWINSLIARGLAPKIIELELVEDWAEAERYWIAALRSEGFDLLNITVGGGSSVSHDEKTREKISKKVKEYYSNRVSRVAPRMGAKKQWKTSRETLLPALRKVWKSKEFRTHQSEIKKKMWATQEYRNAVLEGQRKADHKTGALAMWQRPEYRAAREKLKDDPQHRERFNKAMKDVWARRRAGLLPMPKRSGC